MIVLHRPAFEELSFRQEMLADPETMAYNLPWGGTIPFPPEAWERWYDAWVVREDGKRFYRYLLDDETGRFVGEVAYHWTGDENPVCLADVLITASCRRRGFGTQGLEVLCREAKNRGVGVLYDDVAAGNPGLELFLKNGFEETGSADGGQSVRVRKKL